MEELNTFSETWPRSGSLRNGQVFERQTLAHHTEESESSSWATPTGRDYKDGSNPSDKVPTNALLGRQAPRTPMPGNKSMNNTSLRLNPKFVEWLMGWPEGWVGLTNSESSATE